MKTKKETLSKITAFMFWVHKCPLSPKTKERGGTRNHPTIITSLFILYLCPLLYICYYFPYYIHQVFLSFLQTFLWTLFKCVYPLSSQFIHLILHRSVSLSTYISVSWHLSLHPSLPLHLHLLFHMALLSFQRGTVSSASEQPFLEVSRWF